LKVRAAGFEEAEAQVKAAPSQVCRD